MLKYEAYSALRSISFKHEKPSLSPPPHYAQQTWNVLKELLEISEADIKNLYINNIVE